MPSPYEFKRVSCPVHGSIGLSRLEVDIINTPAFQRLRGVKQLGLANYVFPGADYSRFAHSVGACYLAGRVLTTLSDGGYSMAPEEITRYRVAALLHDLGHYPFSHAMEHAVGNFYKASLYEKAGGNGAEAPVGEGLNHEELGKEILARDPQLKSVLTAHGVELDDVVRAFRKEEPSPLTKLISSDLDVDRMDYLLRTACHSGLPYGSLDVEYLLSHFLVKDGRLCVDDRALRTADHFLLCRYFDYQQLTYHKSVVGLELVLKNVLDELLAAGSLQCDQESLYTMIENRNWGKFDDAFVIGEMRKLRESARGQSALKLTSLLERRPPKLVAADERLVKRDYDLDGLKNRIKYLQEHIPGWSEKYGIAADLWYEWKNRMPLTNVGTSLPIEAIGDFDPEENEKSIWIWDRSRESAATIMSIKRSLTNVLADREAHIVRLYVLVPDDKLSNFSEIKKEIRSELTEYGLFELN